MMTRPCAGCGLDFEDTPIVEHDADSNPNATYYFHNERCHQDWKARRAGEIRCFGADLFTSAKEALLNVGLDWNDNDPVIKVALVDLAVWEADLEEGETILGDYATLDDVPANVILETAATLGTPTIAGGKADGADTTFASVTNAVVIGGLLFYVYNETPASAPLIALIADGYGLPYTASGANVKAVYPTAGIFQVAVA